MKPSKATRARNAAKARQYRDACAEVDQRSGGACEGRMEGVCPPHEHRADHHHHRLLRSQGGPDDASNLMHLCNACHSWAHAHPKDAEAAGIIARRSA